jgi:hypothetical protein
MRSTERSEFEGQFAGRTAGRIVDDPYEEQDHFQW